MEKLYDSKQKNYDNKNWVLCAHWLNDCECLPETIKEKLVEKSLTTKEFGECLRNGEVLFNLLEYLAPDSIDFSKLNTHSIYTPSRTLCIKNIELFLEACKKPPFQMKENDLFDAETLYELDLNPTINTLHKLAHNKGAMARCNGGFHINPDEMEEDDEFIENTDYLDMKDFIFNTPKISTNDSDSDYIQIQKLSDETKSSNLFKNELRSGDVPKHVYVIRELITTEETFINLMDCLVNEYLKPLSPILSDADRKLLNLNFETILNLHRSFNASLYDACICTENRTKRVCDVFNSFKRLFIKDYVDYFLGVDEASNRLKMLMKSKPNSPFQRKLEQCKPDKKYASFSLVNLLIMPFQRLSKYHLMLKELHKLRETSKRTSNSEEETKVYIKETWKSAEVLNAYLNEIKRDQEAISTIKNISNSLNIPFEDLKENGRLKREDKLEVRISSDRNPATRTVFLFQKEIVIIEKNLFGKQKILEKIPIYEIKDINFTSYNTINLLMNDELRKYEFNFKNFEHKTLWRQSIDSLIVKDRLSNNHVFVLSNFGKDLQECVVCNEFLNGYFFQGYKCNYCEIRAHEKCLGKTTPCKVNIANKHNLNKTLRRTNPLNATEDTNDKRKTNTSLDFQIEPSRDDDLIHYKSKVKYKGIPKPPNEPVLLFDENEIIYLLEYNEGEWLKGFKYNFKTKNGADFYKEEGYFPKMCVQKIEIEIELNYYSWYLAGDRDLATKTLNRLMPYTQLKSIFLVRSRAKVENSFAISFTHNNKVAHLKINQETLDSASLKYDNEHVNKSAYNCGYFITKKNAESSANNLPNGMSNLYSIDKRKFLSIPDLVTYYSFNSLKECLHDFDTNLAVSYRDCFPKPKYSLVASDDHVPTGENIQYQIEVVPNHKYFVLDDDDKNWFYVFDTNGLLGYAPRNCFG